LATGPAGKWTMSVTVHVLCNGNEFDEERSERSAADAYRGPGTEARRDGYSICFSCGGSEPRAAAERQRWEEEGECCQTVLIGRLQL